MLNAKEAHYVLPDLRWRSSVLYRASDLRLMANDD
jgi:hypothetical protein